MSNEAPKKIWVDEIYVAGKSSLLLLREEQFGCQEYIRADLAAEPEAEPVAWVTFEQGLISPTVKLVEANKGSKGAFPVYTRPSPARKPMNGDEVLEAFYKADISGLQSFTEGVRCAEEFHKIGGDDE